MSIAAPKAKVTAAVWGHLDDMIITGHESGDIIQWDVSVRNMNSVAFNFCDARPVLVL